MLVTEKFTPKTVEGTCRSRTATEGPRTKHRTPVAKHEQLVALPQQPESLLDLGWSKREGNSHINCLQTVHSESQLKYKLARRPIVSACLTWTNFGEARASVSQWFRRLQCFDLRITTMPQCTCIIAHSEFLVGLFCVNSS